MSTSRHQHDERVWTPETVRQLGMTTDIETAASILGIGRTLAFELARTNHFPVRLLRLGRRIRVPVSELLHYLGGPADRCTQQQDATASPAAQSVTGPDQQT